VRVKTESTPKRGGRKHNFDHHPDGHFDPPLANVPKVWLFIQKSVTHLRDTSLVGHTPRLGHAAIPYNPLTKSVILYIFKQSLTETTHSFSLAQEFNTNTVPEILANLMDVNHIVYTHFIDTLVKECIVRMCVKSRPTSTILTRRLPAAPTALIGNRCLKFHRRND
jgi:hypothetical protein